MDEETARDMDRLLAEGELSGPEADAILARVLEGVEREKRRQRRPQLRRVWIGAASAAVAAAAAVMIVVGLPGRKPQIEEGTLAPVIVIRCAEGTLAACPVRSSIVFAVSGHAGAVTLVAHAERSGAEDGGGRVVYFPRGGDDGRIAAAVDGAPAVERAVRLAGFQKPGRWRVRAGVIGAEGRRVAEREVEVVIVE